MFPQIVVPLKSSILIGFSIINHPTIGGTPIFGNTHMSGIKYDPQLSGDSFNKPWNKDPVVKQPGFPVESKGPRFFFFFCGSNEAQTWKIWILKEVGRWVETWIQGEFTPLFSQWSMIKPRCWFQRFFIFTAIPWEVIPFDLRLAHIFHSCVKGFLRKERCVCICQWAHHKLLAITMRSFMDHKRCSPFNLFQFVGFTFLETNMTPDNLPSPKEITSSDFQRRQILVSGRAYAFFWNLLDWACFHPSRTSFLGPSPFGKAKNQRVYAREFDDRCGEISTFCFGVVGVSWKT